MFATAPREQGTPVFKRRPRPDARPVDATTPAGCVIWAIGDIHGRADLLRPLIEEIRADFSRSSADRRVLVCLGDYIDRGPHSDQVLDILSDLSADPALETYFLRGNHEDRLMAFLTDPEVGRSWSEYGGRETMSSYGVPPPAPQAEAEAWRDASTALLAALPADHYQLLAELRFSVSVGDYFFAHAGARSGVALADQNPTDLMWIRNEFLASRTGFEQVVVHGHTPSPVIHSDSRRIGIDAGAYATGVLTGLRLEGTTRLVMQTDPANGSVRLRRESL